MVGFFRDWGPQLLDGVKVTVIVTVLGFALATVLGVALGLALRLHGAVSRAVPRAFVELFRGSSLYVQLFWLFYVLPLMGVRLDPLAVGVLAIGMNFGAYLAEVVRGAINAIPRTQFDSAVALNLSSYDSMRRVILPQALAMMIPPFANFLIQALKGSALVSLITLTDLTTWSQRYREGGGDVLVAFGVALVIYYILSSVINAVAVWLEARAKAGMGQPPERRAGWFVKTNLGEAGIRP